MGREPGERGAGRREPGIKGCVETGTERQKGAGSGSSGREVDITTPSFPIPLLISSEIMIELVYLTPILVCVCVRFPRFPLFTFSFYPYFLSLPAPSHRGFPNSHHRHHPLYHRTNPPCWICDRGVTVGDSDNSRLN